MDMRCTSLNNGISESFNRGILGPRHKPIITMLEEIRLCIMQRLVAMNKIAFSLEDKITPSIRKRLELLKDKQRYRELSGVPCVHVVAGYMHVGTDLDVGKCASRGGGSGSKGDRSGGSGGRGDGSGGNGGGMSGGGTSSRGGGSRRGGRMARTLRLDRHLTAKEMNMPLVYGVAKKLVNREASALDISVTTADLEEAPYVETTLTIAEIEEAPIEKGNTLATVDKGKALAVEEDKPEPKNKRGRPKTHVDGIKIYYKNLGRS
ncbi:hypothetical protein Tco_0887468 [Tanacetum coccineum]